jgi:hypothetical protein
MRVIRCEQGSEEWRSYRAGLATASEFSSILAKGQGKTRASYLKRVVAERLTGIPTEAYKNGNMDRGHELEPMARAAYEVSRDVMVDQVGLILHDSLKVGASPDGLVGRGGVEIKSVIPTTQVDTIMGGRVPPEHTPQIQGNIWLAEADYWDFVSYCPEMPEHLQLFVVRCSRDEIYIASLESEVRRFLGDVEETVERLNRLGVIRKECEGCGELFANPAEAQVQFRCPECRVTA